MNDSPIVIGRATPSTERRDMDQFNARGDKMVDMNARLVDLTEQTLEQLKLQTAAMQTIAEAARVIAGDRMPARDVQAHNGFKSSGWVIAARFFRPDHHEAVIEFRKNGGWTVDRSEVTVFKSMAGAEVATIGMFVPGAVGNVNMVVTHTSDADKLWAAP